MADHKWGSSVWNTMQGISVTGKGTKPRIKASKDGIEVPVADEAKGGPAVRRRGILAGLIAKLRR